MNGLYAVQAENWLGCGNDYKSPDSISNVSVKNYDNLLKSVSIFPNPAGDWFTIDNLQFINGAAIDLYNALGEKVESKNIDKDEQGTEKVIRISHLPKGVYFIRVKNNNNIWCGKILKE